MTTTHGIFIVDSEFKFLCVHPTGSPELVWSIPKGGAELNETSIEAAIRELKEETNFNYNDFLKYLEYFQTIGNFPYKKRNKTLIAHIAYFNYPLSKANLDLKCLVNIDNSDKLECDIVEWKDMCVALDYLHHTQIEAISEVYDTLMKRFLKK